MPKPAQAAPNAAPAPAEFDVSLDEFCTRLSQRDRRVEMIGAFHSAQRRQGVVKALESAFQEAFDAFVNQPA